MSEKFVPQEKSYDVTNTKSKELDSFAIGDLLHNDRYEILSHLGSGVSSVVKLGADKNTHDREVAIKIVDLRDETIDHTKFLKESKRLSQLDHKGLPFIIEQWQEQDNYFIVMAYAGITLASFCESLSSDDKKVFKNTILKQIYLQILDVMEYIHDHDLAHLDLKPDNILIDHDSLKIKIIDFGLARKMSEESNTKSYKYTMVASHDYASPESRKNSGITKLSDIYSLGGILFYLSHDFTHPPSIPAKDEFSYFTNVIFKAMKGSPKLRYQSIDALRQAFLKDGIALVKVIIPIALLLIVFGFGANYYLNKPSTSKVVIQPALIAKPYLSKENQRSSLDMAINQTSKNNLSLKPQVKTKVKLKKIDLFQEVKLLMKQAESKALLDQPNAAYILYLQANTILSSAIESDINSDDVQALIKGKKLLNGLSDQDFKNQLEVLKTLSKKRETFLQTKSLVSRSNRAAKVLYDKAYMSLRGNDYSNVLKYLDEIKLDYPLSDMGESLESNRFALRGMSYRDIKQAKTKKAKDLMKEQKAKALSLKIATLYKKVKLYSARELEQNRDGYKKLLALAPSNKSYAAKVSYYTNKLKEKAINDLAEKKNLALQKPKGYKDSLSGVEFVYVPSGSFMMGSPSSEKGRYDREGPVHKVKISKGFYLGKYEVRQVEWRKMMSDSPSEFKGDDLPVEQVSFDDIREYLKKLNKSVGCNYSDTIKAIDEGHLSNLKSGCYRLPTEAEWEYSARGGTSTAFSFGDVLSSKLANYNGNYPYNGAKKDEYRKKTTNVGIFGANAFGLYDMHGNVYEWVQDYCDGSYYEKSKSTDPVNNVKASIRVNRGGSWYDSGRYLRSAIRYYDSPSGRSNILGFRLLVVR